MHLCADTSRPRPGAGVGRPELQARQAFGQVFSHGERIPDDQVTVNQHRNLSRGRDRRNGTFELRVSLKGVETNQNLFKRNARLAHQHPGTHGPRRIVLVTEVEFEHFVALRDGLLALSDGMMIMHGQSRRPEALIKGEPHRRHRASDLPGEQNDWFHAGATPGPAGGCAPRTRPRRGRRPAGDAP